jgi:hypothetical protein
MMPGTEWIRLKLTRPFENWTVPKGKAKLTRGIVPVASSAIRYDPLYATRGKTRQGITNG